MKFNDKDIRDSKFMIIGTKGTPHEGSFLMFKIHYGTNYPYKEPKVVIINQKYRTHLIFMFLVSVVEKCVFLSWELGVK